MCPCPGGFDSGVMKSRRAFGAYRFLGSFPTVRTAALLRAFSGVA
jgi:hypothetical protein